MLNEEIIQHPLLYGEGGRNGISEVRIFGWGADLQEQTGETGGYFGFYPGGKSKDILSKWLYEDGEQLQRG